MSDLQTPGTRKGRSLLLRTLAVVLVFSIMLTVVLSELTEVRLLQYGYAESTAADGTGTAEGDQADSLDRIYSILQDSITAPETFDDYYQLASIGIAQGNYEEALGHLDKCLEMTAEDDLAVLCDVWTKKGSLYALMVQYDEALACLDTALDCDPEAEQALLLRAQIEIEQGNYEVAAVDLSAYVKLAPEETGLMVTLAQLYEATAQYEKARECYDALLLKDENDKAQRLNSLRCTFLMGEYQEALDGLNAYLSYDEGDGEAVITVGADVPGDADVPDETKAPGDTNVPDETKAPGDTNVLDETKAPGEADASGDANVPEEAGAPEQVEYAHYLRALCLMQMQNYKGAVPDLEAAMELKYDAALCYEQLAACHYALEQHEQVLACGEQLIALKSTATVYDVLYQRMGVSAMTLEKYEDAVQYFSQSIELNDELAGSHYYRGVCLLALENYTEAIEDFTASIEQNFLLQYCYYNRGVCYVQLVDYESALSDMEKTLTAGDDESLKKAATDVLWQMAQYYENAEQQATGAGAADSDDKGTDSDIEAAD